nr:MAG: nonstructural protein [Microvirus sp.]
MKHNIFAVYDSKGQSYTTPFFDHAPGRALRTFADCCNDDGHQFGKHPSDYTLFDLGQYDDETGTITQDVISSVATGNTLLEAI